MMAAELDIDLDGSISFDEYMRWVLGAGWHVSNSDHLLHETKLCNQASICKRTGVAHGAVAVGSALAATSN